MPTGSLRQGVSHLLFLWPELGPNHLAMPTNGTAGEMVIASFAGLRTMIFCPDDTPEINISEIELQGASVYRVNGL